MLGFPILASLPAAMLDRRFNVTKSLYDSDGYRHCLVQATPQQILTLLEGFYWLWDRASGRCLIEGMGAVRLGNCKPSYGALQAHRSRVEETRALLLAQRAMMKAAISSSSAAAPAPTPLRAQVPAPTTTQNQTQQETPALAPRAAGPASPPRTRAVRRRAADAP